MLHYSQLVLNVEMLYNDIWKTIRLIQRCFGGSTFWGSNFVFSYELYTPHVWGFCFSQESVQYIN